MRGIKKMAVAALALLTLAGCITVEAPDKPIVIELKPSCRNTSSVSSSWRPLSVAPVPRLIGVPVVRGWIVKAPLGISYGLFTVCTGALQFMKLILSTATERLVALQTKPR